MASGYEKSPHYGGLEPTPLGILGVAVLVIAVDLVVGFVWPC